MFKNGKNEEEESLSEWLRKTEKRWITGAWICLGIGIVLFFICNFKVIF